LLVVVEKNRDVVVEDKDVACSLSKTILVEEN